eukprot:m.111965 g.111965  ORF g.111965 m.111965 type:complete len:73 (-) comp12773_c0_seq12:780-998(-)
MFSNTSCKVSSQRRPSLQTIFDLLSVFPVMSLQFEIELAILLVDVVDVAFTVNSSLLLPLLLFLQLRFNISY